MPPKKSLQIKRQSIALANEKRRHSMGSMPATDAPPISSPEKKKARRNENEGDDPQQERDALPLGTVSSTQSATPSPEGRLEDDRRRDGRGSAVIRRDQQHGRARAPGDDDAGDDDAGDDDAYIIVYHLLTVSRKFPY